MRRYGRWAEIVSIVVSVGDADAVLDGVSG
jgi:hypothetical protein